MGGEGGDKFGLIVYKVGDFAVKHTPRTPPIISPIRFGLGR